MTKFLNRRPKRVLDSSFIGAKVGLIALATDINIESDMRKIYPSNVHCFTTRVRNENPLTIDNLRKMEGKMGVAVDSILPGTELDVVVYGCTSGAIAMGVSRVERLIEEVRPGVPVVNPAGASLEAFSCYGAKKISILTPYTEGVNGELVRFYEGHGYEVLSIGGFGFEEDTSMTFIRPEDIVEAALEVCDEEADVLFLSCTALRSLEVLGELEERLGRPVMSSNQVLAWYSLRLMSYGDRIGGYGSLLERY